MAEESKEESHMTKRATYYKLRCRAIGQFFRSLDLRQLQPIFCHFPYALASVVFPPSSPLYPRATMRLTSGLESGSPCRVLTKQNGGPTWSQSSNQKKISSDSSIQGSGPKLLVCANVC